MSTKFNLMKSLVVGGAVAAAFAVIPATAAEAFAAGPATTSATPTHVVFQQDPGGGGCDANGNCGSGGQFNGPGGGPAGKAVSLVSVAARGARTRVQAAYRAVADAYPALVAAPATADPPRSFAFQAADA